MKLKKMSLRKVKTDAIDAFRLGELYPIFPHSKTLGESRKMGMMIQLFYPRIT